MKAPYWVFVGVLAVLIGLVAYDIGLRRGANQSVPVPVPRIEADTLAPKVGDYNAALQVIDQKIQKRDAEVSEYQRISAQVDQEQAHAIDSGQDATGIIQANIDGIQRQTQWLAQTRAEIESLVRQATTLRRGFCNLPEFISSYRGTRFVTDADAWASESEGKALQYYEKRG